MTNNIMFITILRKKHLCSSELLWTIRLNRHGVQIYGRAGSRASIKTPKTILYLYNTFALTVQIIIIIIFFLSKEPNEKIIIC